MLADAGLHSPSEAGQTGRTGHLQGLVGSSPAILCPWPIALVGGLMR